MFIMKLNWNHVRFETKVVIISWHFVAKRSFQLLYCSDDNCTIHLVLLSLERVLELLWIDESDSPRSNVTPTSIRSYRSGRTHLFSRRRSRVCDGFCSFGHVALITTTNKKFLGNIDYNLCVCAQVSKEKAALSRQMPPAVSMLCPVPQLPVNCDQLCERFLSKRHHHREKTCRTALN